MPAQVSMIFVSVHNLLLSVHTAAEPDANVWRRYLAAIERRQNELCGILVLQPAGWPSFRRWRELRQHLVGRRRLRVAFLISSRLQRAAVMALSWLADWDAAAFAPRDLAAGLDFLIQGDGALLRTDVEHTLADMSASLDVRG